MLFESKSPVVYNYLNHELFECSLDCLFLLAQLADWVDRITLLELCGRFDSQSLALAIRQLIELGCVVVEGTEEAGRDEEFERSWLWGPIAGLYHFGTSRLDFLPIEKADAILRERAKTEPSPKLYTTNENLRLVINLPNPDARSEPFSSLARRRTNRIMLNRTITLAEISECLLFSLGITGILENPGICDLPLKMTPSGGARNPYEAYVCTRKVRGVAPGTYHYSSFEHNLGLVSAEVPPPFPLLLANQLWTSTAAAVVFLVANFDRPMWKYRDPGAYRVVLIEAGHIAQNIMIVAAKRRLVANPTCAITQALTEKTLGIHRLTDAVVYAIVLGVPAKKQEWQLAAYAP